MQIECFYHEAGSGWSQHPLPTLDSPRTLVLAFGASAYATDPKPFDTLRRAYPEAVIAGCSTAGEILGSAIRDDSLVVAVTRFQHSDLRTVCARIEPGADAAAGRAVARRLHAPNLRSVLVLSEGLHINGSALVAGVNEGLAEDVVVTGGLAGDGDRFRQTWVLCDGQPVTQQVAAVGFYGTRLRIGHGSRGGWDSFGPERLVTRARGSVLYELDGRPALALYKDYLGELAAGLPATGLRFPLALRAGADDPRRLVRTILGTNETDGSMIFAGDVPEGYRAQLMRASFERLIDGAEEAAAITRARGGDGPALAIAISCVGRRIVLGERSEEEVEITLAQLPPGSRQIGFYSYGELSPYATGRCDLHNQTMTLTTIGEAAP